MRKKWGLQIVMLCCVYAYSVLTRASEMGIMVFIFRH